jgi:hypothetical protein
MSATYGPGYAALYSSLVFLVVIIISFFFNKGGIVGAIEGGIFKIFTTILSFLPYIILAWGFTMDLFTLQFRYTVASLAGIHTIILCVICSYIFGAFAPMFVASSAAVLTYYTFDYLVKYADKKPLMAILMVLGSLLTLLGQTLSGSPSVGPSYLFSTALTNDAFGAAVGVSCGLGAWLTTYASSPAVLPYATEHYTEHMHKKVNPSTT